MKIELVPDHHLRRILLDHECRDSDVVLSAFREVLRRRDLFVTRLGLDRYDEALAKGHRAVCWKCGSCDDRHMRKDAEWGVCHSHRLRWQSGQSTWAFYDPVDPDPDHLPKAKGAPRFPKHYEVVPPVWVEDWNADLLAFVCRLVESKCLHDGSAEI